MHPWKYSICGNARVRRSLCTRPRLPVDTQILDTYYRNGYSTFDAIQKNDPRTANCASSSNCAPARHAGVSDVERKRHGVRRAFPDVSHFRTLPT